MFTLDIGTEPAQIALMVSLLLSLALVLVFARSLWSSKIGCWFLFACLLLPAYKNLEFFRMEPELLTPAGMTDMWVRHIVFYLGQLFFFLFIFRLLAAQTPLGKPKRAKVAAGVLVAAYVAFLLVPTAARAIGTVDIFELPPTPYNILLFATDQGIQHLLAVLFFFLQIAIIRTQQLYVGNDRLKNFVNFCFLANALFILLHVWEYLFETLGLFPFVSDEGGEFGEFLCQLGGVALLFAAGKRVRAFLSPKS